MIFWGLLFIIGLTLSSSTYGSAPLGPTFYNLKYAETNVRFGPSPQSPRKFSLTCQGLPVEVIETHEEWYRIHDFEGEEGWILKRMVSQNNLVLMIKDTPLQKDKKSGSSIRARLSKGVLVKLKKCDNKWCEVETRTKSTRGIKGWVPEKNIWGVNGNRS